MRRILPLALLATLSCNGIYETGVPLGMTIRIPQIDFNRLDDQLHLRIFPAGSYACNATSGQVTRGGSPVFDFGGGAVRPFERCGSSWNTLQAMYGLATPVDVCFSKSGDQGENVPPGNYVILVEGSNDITADPSAAHYTIASGCAVQNVGANSSTTLQIVMVEQSMTGRCGDGMVLGNEDCDVMGANAAGNACDETCHYTERGVGTTTMGLRKNPALAWAVNQPLVIGFEAATDVWVHYFDASGQPITSGPAAADIPADTGVSRNRQSNLALAASTAGWAAGWLSTADAANPDVHGTIATSYDPTITVPTDAKLNTAPESTTAADRTDVAVATSSTAVLWGFIDSATTDVRLVAAPATGTPAMPSPDAAITMTGPGSTGASWLRLAATGTGFVAVWASNTGGDSDVYAVRVSATGTAVGTPVRVNASTTGNQDQPAVAASGSDIEIAWRDDSHADPADTSGTTVRFRHFDTTLTPEASDHLAPTTVDGNQEHPAVALGTSSNVLIAWQNTSDGSIRGRFFSTSGSAAPNHFDGTPSDFAVNAVMGVESGASAGPRVNPVAAFGGMSRFAVAWEDDSGAPTSSDIHVRVLLSN